MSNPFERKFTQFAQNQSVVNKQQKSQDLAEIAEDIYQDKPFTVEFQDLFKVSKVGQMVTQVVTFLATASLGVFALSHIIPNQLGFYLALPIACLFAFGVEKVKRGTLSKAAKCYLKYNELGGVGVAAFLVMLISIFAALYGAKELPSVIYPKPEKVVNSERVKALNSDIERTQKDIERIQGNLSKQDNWVGENRTLPNLQKTRASLIEQRTQAEKEALERGDIEHGEAIATRAEKVSKLQVYSVVTAVIAELIFLICTGFIFYYLFRQFAENNATKTEKAKERERYAVANLADNDNRITKIVANFRFCENCNEQYEHKHSKQKYCSDDCRILAWESRTGQDLKKGKKA